MASDSASKYIRESYWNPRSPSFIIVVATLHSQWRQQKETACTTKRDKETRIDSRERESFERAYCMQSRDRLFFLYKTSQFCTKI